MRVRSTCVPAKAKASRSKAKASSFAPLLFARSSSRNRTFASYRLPIQSQTQSLGSSPLLSFSKQIQITHDIRICDFLPLQIQIQIQIRVHFVISFSQTQCRYLLPVLTVLTCDARARGVYSQSSPFTSAVCFCSFEFGFELELSGARVFREWFHVFGFKCRSVVCAGGGGGDTAGGEHSAKGMSCPCALLFLLHFSYIENMASTVQQVL